MEASVPVSDIQPPTTGRLPASEVRVRGRFTPLGSQFLFRGTVSGLYTDACFRCLEPARASVEVEVAWVFEEGTSSVYTELEHSLDPDGADGYEKSPGDETKCSFHGPEIDLGPFVWEELVFALPSRFICNEACKGLCPRCGKNLNTDVCDCSDDTVIEPAGHSGLAALAQLFPELAPDKKKE